MKDTVEERIREFLFWADAEAGLSPNTVAAYRRDLADYRAFLGQKGVAPARIQAHHILAYMSALRRSGPQDQARQGEITPHEKATRSRP